MRDHVGLGEGGGTHKRGLQYSSHFASGKYYEFIIGMWVKEIIIVCEPQVSIGAG